MAEVSSQTLHIVARELSAELNEARAALEAFGEQQENPVLLRKCHEHLHSVHGALRVAEVYGAALLAEEMGQVSRYLIDNFAEKRHLAEGLDALMRAMVQLPTYLERVMSGGRDMALVLLPLLNDLRAVRGHALLSEGTLLLLNLSSDQQANPQPGSGAQPALNAAQWARKLRGRFQLGLLGWIKGERVDQNLEMLAGAAEKLEQVASTQPVFQLWWVVGAVLEALREGGLDGSPSIKRLLGHADREMKRLYESGEARYADSPPLELLNNLLYYVARARNSGARVAAVRASFRLNELLPVDDSIEQARESLSAPSVKLMKTVAAAIKEDLGRVKDALDIFVRQGGTQVDELAPQLELLKKIADTLGVLGLGELRDKVQIETAGLQAIVAQRSPASEAALLGMAATLIKVEDSLDEQLVGMIVPAPADSEQAQRPTDAEDIEFRQVAEAVLRECIVNMARIKETVAHSMEKPREAQAVDQIPQLVRGITAGLLMLGKTRAVEIMEGVDRELSRFLRSDGLTLPQEAVDRLADAIVAVEYYMETLQAGRTDPWYMLDNAEACLKFLGQARAVPRAELADSEHTRTLVIEPMSTTVAAPTEHERTAVLYRTVEPASAKAPAAAPRTPPAKTPDRDIDPEFLELFIEEAKDEIARLKSLFPRWDENPQDQEALVNVRRSFHTLKGSGRMVGAQLIGEFAWSIENLLNRVINKTLERTPDMMALLREAIAAAPELVEQLESGRAPGVDVERIIALANDISGLRSAAPSVAAPAAGAAPAPAAASAPVGAAQEKKTESRATAQPEIDPALHEIYAKETAGHLAVIREFMAACEQASPPYPVTEQLHRSCHTLIGAARTAGARQGVKVAEPLNRYIRKLYDNSIGLSVAGLQALKDASEAITRVVEHIHEDTGFFVDHPKLIARLNELEHSLDVEISRLAEALDATMERPALESHEAGRRANLEPFGANTDDVADTGDVIEIEPTDASMLAVMNWSFEHLPPPSRPANGAHQSDSAQSAPPQQVAPQAPEFLASKDSTLAAPELDAQQTESLAVEVSAAGDFALEDADVQVADAEPAESRDSKLDLLQAEPSAAQHPDRPRQEDALDGVLVEESAAQRTPAGADDAEIGSDIVVETAAWAADFKAPVLQAEPSESSSDAALTQPSGEDCTLETATIVADPDSVGAPAPLETPRAPTAAAAAALEAPGQDSEDDASDADFDPEVAAIFAEEAAELLEAADQSLSSWRSDRANNALVFELKRVVHTLKGGARMAGVRAMGDLSHELETFMQLVESGQVPAEESVFDALQASLDELHRMRDLVNQGERCAPARQLMARIRALAAEPESASEPAPASPSPQPAAAVESSRADHAEPPVLDEYVEVLAPQASSATDIVPTLTEAFIGPDVEPQPTASAAPASGLADSAAAERGGEAAQTAPDAFPEGVTGDVDAQPVGSGAELRASPADDLEVIGGAVVEGADTGVDEDGANAVSADADSELQAELGADELGAAAPRESVRVSETPPASAAVEQAALDVASLAPELPPDAAEAPPERAPALPGRERQAVERQEFARVDAELLDTLLNNAGEVSIFRSRLEQQVSSIEFNLAELGRTVTRLKEQLRKLELETEAQILHRHEDERPGRADFDPLELDRYSTIQQLSRAFAESVSDVASIEGLLENLTREAQNLLLQQSRVVTELQNGLMRTRMVPFQRHVQRLSRLVRQVAADTQKRAELVVVGASGELDRQVLERMLPPFEHMLRNSVVHGMETPQERIAAGKPETGVIRVGLHREGSEMVIVLEDDGRGIDVDAVRERARARGLLKPGRELSDEEALQLILEPGFSTASAVTQHAGRGVGMDVVVNEIKKLGGALFTESKPGQGAKFTIRLPFTLAITQALIVRTGEELYALPLPSVEGVARVPRSLVQQHLAEETPTFNYGGQIYRFQHLGAFIGGGPSTLPEADVSAPVILIRAGEHSTAVITDELVGSREMVVKSVGPQIAGIRGIAGATILGDGRIVIILDMGALVRSEWRGRAQLAQDPKQDQRTFALVVDDSITVRRVTQRLLERNGMRVMTAKDGVDALSILQEHVPDVILLDIEMPRMDGYELASHVRADARLADVPIVMITSRVGEKHRARAIELGVNDYLGKPYQENQLLDAIEPLVEARKKATRGW